MPGVHQRLFLNILCEKKLESHSGKTTPTAAKLERNMPGSRNDLNPS